ncbi:hypothetical protein SERLADRAFT_405934 [Serpula lacrymans var. lacrymans S7.9]|uniref:DUF6589 domain-containing protein n=1 Tax=Serpula lacrymans var. lacrymans (strain S7.9) TaxID=578457 RepID=F8NK97_SERL9|nr:uncharacterized protein SERLADRAFT_405934 [Serpula lacrymans var. lacrymans S7.9]EGO28363.1 hypothetical protein SERLADRAFT_405934 [Serpula lacrymans var. lacrymans S7.9]
MSCWLLIVERHLESRDVTQINTLSLAQTKEADKSYWHNVDDLDLEGLVKNIVSDPSTCAHRVTELKRALLTVTLGQTLLAAYAYNNFNIDLKTTKHTVKKSTNSLKYLPLGLRCFKDQIKPPTAMEPIPIVQTPIIPARAMDVNNSTVSGNICAVVELMAQGGFEEEILLSDYVVLFHGDLGTEECLQALQQRIFIADHRLFKMHQCSNEMHNQQHENTLLFNKYALHYEELTHAMNTGDIRRAESCIVPWIPIFKATGKHKYPTHMKDFLINLHYNYPPGLKCTIQYNILINPSGKAGKFQAVDWYLELYNLFTKTLHTLLADMQVQSAYDFKLGCTSKHSIPDLLNRGMYMMEIGDSVKTWETRCFKQIRLHYILAWLLFLQQEEEVNVGRGSIEMWAQQMCGLEMLFELCKSQSIGNFGQLDNVEVKPVEECEVMLQQVSGDGTKQQEQPSKLDGSHSKWKLGILTGLLVVEVNIKHFSLTLLSWLHIRINKLLLPLQYPTVYLLSHYYLYPFHLALQPTGQQLALIHLPQHALQRCPPFIFGFLIWRQMVPKELGCTDSLLNIVEEYKKLFRRIFDLADAEPNIWLIGRAMDCKEVLSTQEQELGNMWEFILQLIAIAQ